MESDEARGHSDATLLNNNKHSTSNHYLCLKLHCKVSLFCRGDSNGNSLKSNNLEDDRDEWSLFFPNGTTDEHGCCHEGNQRQENTLLQSIPDDHDLYYKLKILEVDIKDTPYFFSSQLQSYTSYEQRRNWKEDDFDKKNLLGSTKKKVQENWKEGRISKSLLIQLIIGLIEPKQDGLSEMELLLLKSLLIQRKPVLQVLMLENLLLMGVTFERVLQKNELTLKDKIRVLSIELENTTNLLKHSERINAIAETARINYRQKLDNHLVQNEKCRTSSKNLFRLNDSSMSIRTKVSLGFNNYIRENKLGWDDSAFSVFYHILLKKWQVVLLSIGCQADSMKAVPPPLSGDYTPLSDHIDLDESQMSYVTSVFPSVSHLKSEAEIESNVGTPIQEPIIVQDLPSFLGISIEKVILENPYLDAEDEGIFDSGCSRSIIGNIGIRLDDFQEFQGGKVTFGGGEGRITRKGTIRTPTLDFENVYYVKELQQFNLFSISQICDKKNRVLFTDTDCLVLSKDFMLPDETWTYFDEKKSHTGSSSVPSGVTRVPTSSFHFSYWLTTSYFLQTILGIETSLTRQYQVFKLSSKLFANMKLNFEGQPMQLLAAMLPQDHEVKVQVFLLLFRSCDCDSIFLMGGAS
ncbi:hypothetical protein Tco_0268801 [Tanacetum coccineum]